MFLFHKLQHTRFSLSFSSFCAHHHLSASLSLQPSCVRVQRHRAPHTRPFLQGRSLPGLLLLALCRRARVHAVRLASGWLQQTIAKLQQQFAMEAGGGAMKRQTATGEHSFVGRAGGGAARGRNADMCVKQQDGPRSCCAVRQRFRATARWLGWHARIRGHTLCFAHAANAALSQQLAGGGGKPPRWPPPPTSRALGLAQASLLLRAASPSSSRCGYLVREALSAPRLRPGTRRAVRAPPHGGTHTLATLPHLSPALANATPELSTKYLTLTRRPPRTTTTPTPPNKQSTAQSRWSAA